MKANLKSSARSAQRKTIEKIGFGFLSAVAILTIVPILYIVVLIFVRGFSSIDLEFVFGFPSNGMRSGGIFPAVVGTVFLTFFTTLFAVPLGIAAGIYLSEYAADNRWTRLIRIAIINLAGIPSIVYGLFGLGIFVLFFNLGTSILAASLTLASAP